MGDRSKIQWTDASWNPIRGCSRVSEGCRFCYAERHAARFVGPGLPYEGLTTDGKWNGTIRVVEGHLADPLRWTKPRRIFVNSMSDLFHANVPDEWIDRIFAVMALSPRHTFQILTKRPERMREYLAGLDVERIFAAADRVGGDEGGVFAANWVNGFSRPREVADDGNPANGTVRRWPLPNVWLGVSVEDQATADARIPLLLQTPAAVRFVSYEPALGPVDFARLKYGDEKCACGFQVVQNAFNASIDCPALSRIGKCTEGPEPIDAGTLDWIIVGGESGPGARPCDVAWIRSVREQCADADVPCFVKQLGSRPRGWCVARRFEIGGEPESSYDADHCDLYEAGECGVACGDLGCREMTDRKGGDPSEWPKGLGVREFPKVTHAE